MSTPLHNGCLSIRVKFSRTLRRSRKTKLLNSFVVLWSLCFPRYQLCSYMHVLSNWLEKTCCLREGLELIRSHQLEPHLHQQLLQMAQSAGSTDQARQTITAPQATAASAGPPQSASESAPILPLCLLLLVL